MIQAPRQTVVSIIFGNELFGKERGTFEALKALKSSGVEIVVCVSGREPNGGRVGDEARANGFTTVIFPGGTQFHLPWFYRNPRFFFRQVGRLFTNSLALLRVQVKYKPNAILLNSTGPFLFCRLALGILRTPVIYRIGDAPPTDSKFQMMLWRQLIKRSTRIVCISHFIAKQVQSHVATNLHNQIDIIWNRAVTRVDGKQFEKPLDEATDILPDLRIVYLGQMSKKKGVDLLVQAALNLNNPEIQLDIVGGSSHSAAFEETLKKLRQNSESLTRIQFCGYTANPEIYLSRADWHIAPSAYAEPLGNVVQEAKMLGIPSVVSNKGGLPELIRHGIDGFVLREVSIQAIQEQIQSLLRCKPEWPTMGQAAKSSLDGGLSSARYNAAWEMVWSESTRENHRF
jgi:glycosyltransferase involved in cell wall biosynthesis